MESSHAQAPSIDSNFHLYLLIGQSNMAGRGVPDSLSVPGNPRILMLDSMNHWVMAKDPVHFDKPAMAGVGPGLQFAKQMLEADPQIKIGLIPCAWGGSPIKVWEPGEVYLVNHYPYDEAISRTKLAMKQGVLKGILWHQGESDNDSLHAVVYLYKLESLILRLRNELHLPALPFVAGELGYFLKKDLINKELKKLPGTVPHTAVVSAEGLTDKGDALHFNTSSARALGIRYAQAMQLLLKENK